MSSFTPGFFSRHTDNTLRPPAPRSLHYCFITCREGPPEGPWRVVGECINAAWMNAVWHDFTQTPFGKAVDAATFGQDFGDAVARGGEPFRALLGQSLDWFCREITTPRDVPWEPSAIELFHEPTSPWDIQLSAWYELELGDVVEGSKAITLMRTRLIESEEPPWQNDPEERTLVSVREVLAAVFGGEITRGGLHALHTLEGVGAWDGDDGGGVVSGGGQPVPVPRTGHTPMEIERPVRDDPQPPPIAVGKIVEGLHARGRELAQRLRDFFDGGFGPGLALTLPGGGSLRLSMHAPEPQRRPAPVRYCGSPSDGAGSQQANPVPGGRAVVLDVGQGNCNAIYDAAGNIVAYYDMGWPWGTMEASQPNVPPPPLTVTQPCVCARPLIILSHRDLDHYRRALIRASVCQMKWLIPAGGGQNAVDAHGPYFHQLVSRIKRHGGEIICWQNVPAPAPRAHMAFPWGFVERCTGTSVNGSGLAAYVCLRNDPAVTRAKAAALAVTHPPPGEVVVGAHADTALYARAVAAAVAGSSLGAGIAAGEIARAAVRAVLSTLGGAAGAAAVAIDVNNVAAFGVAMPALAGGALANAVRDAVAGAAWAIVPIGNAAGLAAHQARVGAAAPAVAAAVLAAGGGTSLPASVLVPIAYPLAGGGMAGLQTESAVFMPHGRAAVAAVPGVIAGLAGPPANLAAYAIPIAAALAITARDLNAAIPALDAAIAGVRAAVAVLSNPGIAVGNLRTFINNAHNLLCAAPAIPAPLGALLRDLTAGAAQAVRVLGAGAAQAIARDRAAENAFGLVPGPVTCARELLANFTIIPTAAPFAPGERYALLNGDADFNVLPSLQPVAANAPLPLVVAMTAMHHGSFIEDGLFLESGRIPWAPGTAEAGVPNNAAIGWAPQSLAHSIADVTDHLNGVAIGGLAASLAHVGAAAASAVLVGHFYLAAQWANLLVNPDKRNNFAAGAAAAAVCTMNAPAEAGEVALAAVHACATRLGAGSTFQFVQSAALVRAHIRGTGILFHELQTYAVHAVAASGNLFAGAGAMGQVATVVGGLPGPPPANTQALAMPVAALGTTQNAFVASATMALAAVRAVIATINGVADVATAIWSGDGLGCGAAVPAGMIAQDCIELAKAAKAIVAAGPARVAAAMAAVGAVPGAAAVGLPVLWPTDTARILAAALGMADRAGLAAGRIAQAAVRAAVAVEQNVGNAVLVVAAINSGVANIGAHAPATLAGAGGNLPGRVATGLAQAAAAVNGLPYAVHYLRYQARAEAAVWAMNQAAVEDIVAIVRAPHRPVATLLVGVPAYFVGAHVALALGHANVEQEARTSADYLPEGFSGDRTMGLHDLQLCAVLAELAHAGAAAAAGLGNECNAAEAALGIAPGLAATVSAQLAFPASTAFGNTLNDTARLAAYYAMIGEAQHLSGIAAERIEAVIDAELTGTRAAAGNAAAVGGGAGIIAYSYGVMPPNRHCYTNAKTIGGLGHPHPLAINHYRAHGWTNRRNTSMRANHGGVQSDNSARGHASMEWNAGADAPVAAAVVAIPACPTCGQLINVNT